MYFNTKKCFIAEEVLYLTINEFVKGTEDKTYFREHNNIYDNDNMTMQGF